MKRSSTDSADNQRTRPLPVQTGSLYDRFEIAWRAAGSDEPRPRIAEYLGELPEPQRPTALPILLALELRCRQEKGEEPSATEYVHLFPEAAALIGNLFEDMGIPARTRTEPRVAGAFEHTGAWDRVNDPAGLPSDLLATPVKTQQRERTKASESGEAASGTNGVPLPQIPGYVVIEELGQGGMGIVYKAHHIELDRVVALKMIRPGRDSSREGSGRDYFLAEARAVAQFQHPNLVQIYEIGELYGQPYFSLEFLDGGNLSQKLAGSPQPAAQTAALVETLARAVEYAHQKGVVHRDLKPANILLTSDGTPKVADFGLAKRLDAEAASEEAGILGTPSYMAPEQARGENRGVGPLADVWALGAILYECLTGRPPFKAADRRKTIQQVLTQDLVPPRLLVPQVPRDLELICLRCLQKDPARRFATARELADELRRFQEGRPIRTRPTPWWEHAWKWCRRQPVAASLIAVSALAVVTLILYLNEQARAARSELEARRQTETRRHQIQDLYHRAREAAGRDDLAAARGHFQAALELVRTPPPLDDIEGPLLTLGEELGKREGQRREEAEAQGKYRRFFEHRDTALFRGMVFEGVDLPTGVAATRQACREALGLFGLAEAAGPLTLPGPLSADQKRQCTDGCYELLLVWAEAEAQRDAPRTAAAEALRLLERAARLGRPTKAYHLRRAAYLDLQGDARAAGDERRKADRTPPLGALDHFLIGRAIHKQGRPEDAAVEFAAALRADPHHFWARYFLGVCNLQRTRPAPAQARDNFTDCLRDRPEFLWLYLLRGAAYGQMGDIRSADEDYRRAEDLKPDDQVRFGILVNRGVLCLRQARLAEPFPVPWPAPAVPNLLLACQAVANAHRQERLAAGVALLERADQLKPGHHVAARYLAQLKQLQKRPDEAAGHFDRALRATDAPPVRAHLYGQRARLYRELGKLAESLEDLGRALRIAPNADDHAERGRVLHLRHQYPEAVVEYDAALRLRPEADLHRQKAHALLSAGRDAEAADALSLYLRAGGVPTAEVYRTRGMIRAGLRQLPLALSDYTQALTLRPTSAAHAARGWLHLASAAQPLALHDFEEAIRLDAGNGEAHAGRGLIRVRLGKPAEALADAEWAQARGPRTSRLLWNIAHVYAQLALYLDGKPGERNARDGLTPDRCRERAVRLLRAAFTEVPEKERPGFWEQHVAEDELLSPVRGETGYKQLARQYGR